MAVEADPATVVNPVTVVIGVLSVTNDLSAVVGIDEETDQELRVRRNRSLETPQSSSTGRMFTALANLPSVTDVAVYENDTDITDTDGIRFRPDPVFIPTSSPWKDCGPIHGEGIPDDTT